MRQLYITLGTPVIELPIKATDISGEKAAAIIGFKRNNLEQANALMQYVDSIMDDNTATSDEKDSKLRAIFTDQVKFIKNFDLIALDEAGEPVLYKTIADTRTETDTELQGSSGCLAFLLDMILTNQPWSSALTKGLYAVNYNTQFGEEAEIKN